MTQRGTRAHLLARKARFGLIKKHAVRMMPAEELVDEVMAGRLSVTAQRPGPDDVTRTTGIRIWVKPGMGGCRVLSFGFAGFDDAARGDHVQVPGFSYNPRWPLVSPAPANTPCVISRTRGMPDERVGQLACPSRLPHPCRTAARRTAGAAPEGYPKPVSR